MSKRTAIYTVIIFFLGVLNWALEASHYNSYLDLRALLRTSALLTLAVWGGAAVFVRRWWWRKELAGWQQLQRVLVIGFAALLFVPPLFSATNRRGTVQQAIDTTVEYKQEVARYQSRFGNAELNSGSRKPSQYLLFFYLNNQLYRVAYEEGPKFATQKEGDTISLPVSAGRWGFAWIPTEKI